MTNEQAIQILQALVDRALAAGLFRNRAEVMNVMGAVDQLAVAIKPEPLKT